MKRFEIITESIARALEPGSTVQLAPNGQITPLAADTLRAMRVSVLRHGEIASDETGLVGISDFKTVAVGADHTGVDLKRTVLVYLRERGLTATDLGTHSTERIDYPDIAASVARAVIHGEADAGIVIDGAGLGSAIAANKIAGIRSAMASDPIVARYAREHVGVNVLTLGVRLVDTDRAVQVVEAWLSTTIREPRYRRQLVKIQRLEWAEANKSGRMKD